MFTVRDIYNFIDKLAPFDTAMDFDNCGLLVGNFDDKVNKVLLALDITDSVVEEAKEIGANLILSHHPVIFRPIKSLNSNSIPYQLARNNINAICAHTNLDMANGGVNTCLANLLKLKNRTPLSIYRTENYNKIVVFVPCNYSQKVKDAMIKAGAGSFGNYSGCSFKVSGNGSFIPAENANPFIGKIGEIEEVDEDRIELICAPKNTKNVIKEMLKAHPYEEPAFDIFETSSIKNQDVCGLIGETDVELSPKIFAEFTKLKLACNGVRYIEGNRPIKKVALCSGAGGDLIFNAIKLGADAFLTGEIKHHEILAAMKAGITVVDARHFPTEDVVINPLKRVLEDKFYGLSFIKSSTLFNMIKYI